MTTTTVRRVDARIEALQRATAVKLFKPGSHTFHLFAHIEDRAPKRIVRTVTFDGDSVQFEFYDGEPAEYQVLETFVLYEGNVVIEVPPCPGHEGVVHTLHLDPIGLDDRAAMHLEWAEMQNELKALEETMRCERLQALQGLTVSAVVTQSKRVQLTFSDGSTLVMTTADADKALSPPT